MINHLLLLVKGKAEIKYECQQIFFMSQTALPPQIKELRTDCLKDRKPPVQYDAGIETNRGDAPFPCARLLRFKKN